MDTNSTTQFIAAAQDKWRQDRAEAGDRFGSIFWPVSMAVAFGTIIADGLRMLPTLFF